MLSKFRAIRWSSVLTVAVAGLFTLVSLFAALRGRPWAWVVFGLSAAVLVRELRYVQRSGRGHVGFDAPDRREQRD